MFLYITVLFFYGIVYINNNLHKKIHIFNVYMRKRQIFSLKYKRIKPLVGVVLWSSTVKQRYKCVWPYV